MIGTVTILNKLNRKDSITGLDVWYKTVLQNISYSNTVVTDMSGNTVSVGQVITVLIPFTGKYMGYNEWKVCEDKDNHYTMSIGDYIFLGVNLTEDITANNIIAIKNDYEPNVCEVKSIQEAYERDGVMIQLKVSGV